MLTTVKRILSNLFRKFDYDIVRYGPSCENEFPPDFGSLEIEIIQKVSPYTMTSPERLHALIGAVRYIVKNSIPGSIVECGVWKGGSMLAAALTLMQLQDTSRHLYLFDTFEGMAPPSEKDVSIYGVDAKSAMLDANSPIWSFSPLSEVKEVLHTVGYPAENIHFIKGRVEETIPFEAPAQISLLRLDTDWYESTRHELIHLFPRVSLHGVIIIDDYGHWKGAQAAVDQYIEENKIKLLLNRIDYTGRICVKL